MGTDRGYPPQVKEFARVRMEQTPNNLQIARDIKNKFQLDKELDIIRRMVSNWRDAWNVEAKKIPIKRLFFDIEKSHYLVKLFSIGKVRWVDYGKIVKHSEIICISYKWQYEDKVHTLDWRIGQRAMLKEFVKVMAEAHELIGHNIVDFDLKELRTHCIQHGVLMFPTYRTLDTLKKARKFFRFPSNKLDYISTHLNNEGKLEHEGEQLWYAVEDGDEDALKRMISYCERDVAITEDSFFVMSPYIDHNNNFSVLTGGGKWHCPECTSENVMMFRTYSTPLGIIRREMKCKECEKKYKISNKTYMAMLEYEMRGKYIDNSN